MISGENIAQYILNPLEIKQDDLMALGDLVKKYPYASTLHLLELKGLALANSIDFEAKLKSTAIHAPDRGHLYALIHSEAQAEPIVKQAIESSDEEEIVEAVAIESVIENTVIAEETVAEELEEIPTEIPVGETKIALETEIEPEVEVEVITETEVADETKIITTDSESTPEKTKAPKLQLEKTLPIDEDLSELDVDILNKAIDVAFVSSEIEKQAPIENAPAEITEEIIPEIPAAKEVTPAQTDSATISTEETTEIHQGELTFIEWLRLKQAHKAKATESTENLSPFEAEKLKPETTEEIVPIKAKEETIPEERKAETTPQADQGKRDINALLDKFMQEEPRISKPVKDFYNPVKSAQKSVEESDDMVTETLAKIHVLQKNYSKAISAYEKLILLYPEKKAFFASRIEKIREESKKR